jgi:hypothetical protein
MRYSMQLASWQNMVRLDNYWNVHILTIRRGNTKQVVVFSFYLLPRGDYFKMQC